MATAGVRDGGMTIAVCTLVAVEVGVTEDIGDSPEDPVRMRGTTGKFRERECLGKQIGWIEIDLAQQRAAEAYAGDKLVVVRMTDLVPWLDVNNSRVLTAGINVNFTSVIGKGVLCLQHPQTLYVIFLSCVRGHPLVATTGSFPWRVTEFVRVLDTSEPLKSLQRLAQ